MSLTELFIPFPTRLMSTARAPDKMPADFAREIENMYTRLDGAGSKRNGFIPFGQDLDADILRMFTYISPVGDAQILAQTISGNLYLQQPNESWDEVYTGLTAGIPLRSAQLAGELIFCNGEDNLLSWNGTNMTPVEQSIVDVGANLTYINGTTFTIESDDSFYPVGSTVTATLSTGDVTGTVASTIGTSTVTVILNESVLNDTLSAVAFSVRPPKFHYIYAAHDRLWGFGEGAIAPDNLGTAANRARVFYTDAVNDPQAWYDAEGTLQSINIADKMPNQDALQAMAVKDGLTIFFSRTQTQVWTGVDPTVFGDFAWQKTLPIGVVHGNLVVDLPNDVGFFTAHGARTLSRLLQTEQLDVGDVGQEISPTLTTDIATALSDVTTYRAVQNFAYNAQDWFGFYIAGNARVFQFTPSGVGWSTFTGLFSTATTFANGTDGTLYAASENKLYTYDVDSYSDAGEPIFTRWWTPWLNVGNGFRRWANKYIVPITEHGISLPLTLMRYKNYDSSSNISTAVSSTPAASYWDETEWDASYFDNGAPVAERVRDSFVADVFAYAVESNSTVGPLTLFGLRVEGIRER